MPPNIARRLRLNLAQTPIVFSPSEPSRPPGRQGCSQIARPRNFNTSGGPLTLYVTPRRRVHLPSSRREPSLSAREYNRTAAPLARATGGGGGGGGLTYI